MTIQVVISDSGRFRSSFPIQVVIPDLIRCYGLLPHPYGIVMCQSLRMVLELTGGEERDGY
jgi:hypothetical protein